MQEIVRVPIKKNMLVKNDFLLLQELCPIVIYIYIYIAL